MKSRIHHSRHLAAFLVLLASAASVIAQGNYAPVTTADLPGAKLNHYYNEQRKAVFPPDFTWTFTTNKLVIKAGKGPIPIDLLKHLAEGGKDVQRIEAGWTIKNQELVISGIHVDGEPRRTLAKLSLSRTGPTVIRIGERQYVFSPSP